MASGRMLSKRIADDLRLNTMTLEAEYLFFKVLPHLDRDGMIAGDPRIIQATACPLRPELLPLIPELIVEWLSLPCDADQDPFVQRFTHRNGDVLFFPGFLRHNALPHYKREAPSRYPAPPGYERTEDGLVKNPNDAQAVCPMMSGLAPELVQTSSRPSPLLRVKSEELIDDDRAPISPDSLKVEPETPVEAPADPPTPANPDFGLACRLYEQKIGGVLTPTVSEQIAALVDDCAESMRPLDWFDLALDVTLKTDAAQIAAGKGGIDRKWAYAQTVLQNAIKTGRPPEYKEPTAPHKKGTRHNGPNGASRRFVSPVSVRTPTTLDGRYDADGIWQAH